MNIDAQRLSHPGFLVEKLFLDQLKFYREIAERSFHSVAADEATDKNLVSKATKVILTH